MYSGRVLCTVAATYSTALHGLAVCTIRLPFCTQPPTTVPNPSTTLVVTYLLTLLLLLLLLLLLFWLLSECVG